MNRLGAVGFFGALAVVPLVTGEQWLLNIAVFTLLYAVLAVAWNLVGGYAGYPSLGHAAFFGAGAYLAALAYAGRDAGGGYGPFLAAIPIGAVVAVAALPVAWIAMRTRAAVFAIVTITLLFVVQSLAFNLRSITGGSQGMAMPLPPFPAGTYERPFYYALLLLLLLAMLVSRGVASSKAGLYLLAVRADEDKAHGSGVPVTLVKLVAFTISAGFTAATGAIWAYYISFIYPQFAVDPLLTIGIVLMTFLGGRATLWGPVLGAFLLAPVQQYLAYEFGGAQLYLIAYSVLFLVVILLLPQGILPTLTDRVTARREAAPREAGESAGVHTVPPGSSVPPSGTARPEMPQPRPVPPEAGQPEAGPPEAAEPKPEQPEAGEPKPGPPRTVAAPLLEVCGLRKRFGGIVALDGCAFRIGEGTITGLIGPNGSGKTTAFNVITGALRAEAGVVVFNGDRTSHPDPAGMYRRGLVRTFQRPRVFGDLSALENLVAAAGQPWWSAFTPRIRRRERDRAAGLLAEFGLAGQAGQQAGRLSYGQRKLLEFAAVLMSEPRLVLLDEPAAGVHPVLVDTMERHIRERHAAGATFLVVEHDMGLVARLCEQVIVLDRGRRIAAGPVDAIQADPAVLDAYLGG